MARLTGFTYKEINIIIFYFAIPFAYTVLVDKILRTHIWKVLYGLGIVGLLVSIKNFSEFSNKMFDWSVAFLESFKSIGWDYFTASVIICLFVPGFIFIGLFYRYYKLRSDNTVRDRGRGDVDA
jgi:hypothetical protein